MLSLPPSKDFGADRMSARIGKSTCEFHMFAQAPMRVGDQFLSCSVTIMEGDDMQFLFGLDMLRRHQCQVTLTLTQN